MKRVLILFALALSAFVAGCQTTIPKYNFPCTYRAYDAGYCSILQPHRTTTRVLTSLGGAVPGVVCRAFRLKFRSFRG